MKAYKCDICGKYCDYSHNIYGSITIRIGSNLKKKKCINELCDSCYKNLQTYVQEKCFEYMSKDLR